MKILIHQSRSKKILNSSEISDQRPTNPAPTKKPAGSRQFLFCGIAGQARNDREPASTAKKQGTQSILPASPAVKNGYTMTFLRIIGEVDKSDAASGHNSLV